MRVPRSVRHFLCVEDGLVSVEWIALLAGLVVAGVAVVFIVMQNTQESSQVGRVAQPSEFREGQAPSPP